MSQKKWYTKKRYLCLWVLVLLIALSITYRLCKGSKYQQRLKELSEAGYPVSRADLDAAYILPEGAENAADIYLAAFKQYHGPSSSENAWLPCRGNYVRPDDAPPYELNVINAIESNLEKNAQCLDLIDKASTMEYCLWPRTWKYCWYMNDHLSDIKKLAQLLTEQQIYLAQNGFSDETFDSLSLSIALTNSLKAQPYLIDNLVAVAIKAMAAETLEDVLNLTQFNGTQLTALQKQFADLQNPQHLRDAFIAERVILIEYLNMASSQQAQYNSTSPIAQKLYVYSGLHESDAVLMMDCYQQYLEALDLPYHQQQAVFQQADSSLNKGVFAFMHLNLYQVTSILRIHQINLRVIGSLKCAETALAIERYRLVNNALPDSLNALVPDYMESIPLDPGDGKPLRYILHDEGGYTVYTIGPDGIDHQGRDRDQMQKQGQQSPGDNCDWPFTVNH